MARLRTASWSCTADLGRPETPGSPVVERIDSIGLLNDPHFFDPVTRHTRQNIIFALSHRHSFLDLALSFEAFPGLDFASWSNIQYFPKSAATDPFIVTVNPGETPSPRWWMYRRPI